jgi:hypothetical protein
MLRASWEMQIKSPASTHRKTTVKTTKLNS